MNKKKICFIAQFPPPIHGLSKAVETLYLSKMQDFSFEKVNITSNRHILKNVMLITRSKADLFYFTISQTKGGNLRDLLILKLLKILKKKCIIHLHGGYYRQLVDQDLPNWQRKANYKAIKSVEGAIVLGKSLKPIFQDMIEEEKIYVVPNCVDDEYLLNETEFNEKMKNRKQKEVKDVLYLSNFIKEKGYEDVLKLAKLEKERCENGKSKNFHFHFAGKFFSSQEEQEFFNYIAKTDLKDFITYHGVVSGKKKQQLLKQCDIFVLLTNYSKEGQPISILEAMGNGLLIISTIHAGIPDIVENEKTGFLFPKNYNINKIYNCINRLKLSDFEKYSQSAYQKIGKEFTQKKYITNMSDTFKKVMK